jgi:hypothetical protein
MLVYSIVIRLVQLLALIPVGIGISNAGSFFELLNGLAHNRPWNLGEFAERLALCSSPTGLGVALLVGMEALLRRERKRGARSLEFPDEPWLWNPMWAERRIRLSNRRLVVSLLAALFVYAFVLWPVGLWLASQAAAAFVYTFLGVIGLCLLAMMKAAWLNRRWGNSELEIRTLPGVIGGPFQGTVIISESIPDGTEFRVTLNCQRQTTYSSEDSESHSVTETIWQDQKILVKSTTMDRPNAVAIPCSFAIPYSCEPTSLKSLASSRSWGREQDAFEEIYWRLSVRLNDAADLHQVTFDIPVFKTKSSSPDYREDVSIDAPYLAPVDISALIKSIPLTREYSPSGERLRFSLFRKRDFLGLLACALAFSLGVWAIFRFMSLTGAFFAAFVPAFLAIVSYAALVRGLTWKADIEITADKTTFTAGYIWSRRRYEFARGKHPVLDCHAEDRRESGTLYCVRLVPGIGRPCDIIKRLDGKRNAVAVRNWLVMQLGEHRAR